MARYDPFHQQNGLIFKEELCIVLKLWKVDQKQMESFIIWCWRSMEKIFWNDCMRNEEVLHSAKQDRNIKHTIQRRKAKWNGHILCRNCPLKHITVMRRSMTGIRFEKFVVRRFRHCMNITDCTYTYLDSIAYYIPTLYGKAYCCQATNLYSMLLY